MEEIFTDIVGFEGLYQLSSDLNQVKSLEREVNNPRGGTRILKERILKGTIYERGYIRFSLWKDGVKKTLGLHKIIALQYISNPNPEFYNCVNHIDGTPSNNHLNNLEWCTTRFNTIHGSCSQDSEVDYLFVRKKKGKQYQKSPYQAQILTSEGRKSKSFNNPLEAHRWAAQFLDPKEMLTYRFDPSNPSVPIEVNHWDTYIK
jgi:hypothetical protein